MIRITIRSDYPPSLSLQTETPAFSTPVRMVGSAKEGEMTTCVDAPWAFQEQTVKMVRKIYFITAVPST